MLDKEISHAWLQWHLFNLSPSRTFSFERRKRLALFEADETDHNEKM